MTSPTPNKVPFAGQGGAVAGTVAPHRSLTAEIVEPAFVGLRRDVAALRRTYASDLTDGASLKVEPLAF